jgi:predicted phage gp36 major capsid-like protein
MVEMAAKLGINMQALFKNEKERTLAFLFSLDTSKFKNWHNEVKNRVTEAPDTRKGVLQAARKRSDKGDWTPEPKKPDAAFIAAEERRRERDAVGRLLFSHQLLFESGNGLFSGRGNVPLPLLALLL